MGLMYGHTDTLVTADQLMAVPTPAPQGRFHQPISFGDTLELVKHRLARAGIGLTQEEHVLTEDGQTYFSQFLVNVDGFERDGVELMIGLRGSHNQKVPFGLTLGNRVIVCSNLCFSGDLGTFATKQTTNAWRRIPGLVEHAINRIPAMAERESHRIDQYKLFEMKPRWGDAALVEMHRRGAMTAAQLGRAVGEWDAPTYEEHAEDGHTAWRLLNSVTEAMKPTGTSAVNPETLRTRTIQATGFIDEVVGL